MSIRSTAVLAILFFICTAQAAIADVGEIVRIPTPVSPRCIDSNDRVTMTLRRIVTQKTSGFFTSDNQAGVAVIATLNADGTPPAKVPSVNLISISDAGTGQVILPLEYPIASQLPLSTSSPNSLTTKNMQLDLYLEKTRGSNTFGQIITTAGQVLGKLSIPANPFSTAGNQILDFANQIITNETSGAGAEEMASVTLQFSAVPIMDITQCGDFEQTGAIAIIAPTGGRYALRLGNLSTQYCWRYVTDNTYEVQYAAKPAGTMCKDVADASYQEVPNDYVMLVISAISTTSTGGGGAARASAADVEARQRVIQDNARARSLCSALQMSPKLCGAE